MGKWPWEFQEGLSLVVLIAEVPLVVEECYWSGEQVTVALFGFAVPVGVFSYDTTVVGGTRFPCF